MATLDELVTPLTVDEVKAAIYAAVEARGTSTTGWKVGAVVRTIIAGVAIVVAAFSRLIALVARMGFLDLSEEAWLTQVALQVYGVERIAGTFATGEVVLDNAGAGVYSGDPDDLVIVNSTTGKTYRNTEAFSIDAFEEGVVVAVRAVELGSDSTATPGQIDTLETSLPGVTVTNPTALVGTDPEGDLALRDRCRAKIGVLSPNGPRDAYAFVATSAVRSTGEPIGVTRVRTVADGIGGVDVYVATASGGVTGDPEDPDTDLGAIADAIHRQVEPLAITPAVQSAVAEVIDVEYELWVRDTSSLSDEQVEDLVAERLAEFMAAQPIGGQVITPGDPGNVFVSAIEAVIGASLPGREVRVEVTEPADDVELAINDAPVLGTVTATIHQVAGGLI